MTYFPLHDESSNFYADAEDMNDCTVAKLDGSEGDWMMYEPFYWSKGINDYLNNKKYACYSSYPEDEMPPIPDATVLTLDAIKETQGGWLGERKIMSGKPTLMESYTTGQGLFRVQSGRVGLQTCPLPRAFQEQGLSAVCLLMRRETS